MLKKILLYFTIIYSRNHNTFTIQHLSIILLHFSWQFATLDKVDRLVTHSCTFLSTYLHHMKIKIQYFTVHNIGILYFTDSMTSTSNLLTFFFWLPCLLSLSITISRSYAMLKKFLTMISVKGAIKDHQTIINQLILLNCTSRCTCTNAHTVKVYITISW